MTTTTTSTSSTAISNQLAQAAQSIISGSTNSTLDVNTLVTSLVTAKTAGQAATIQNQQNLDNTQLSAIGQLKSTLSSLQTALNGLADGTSLGALTATATGTGMSATTTAGAVAGNYVINVSQLAQANKVSTSSFPTGTTMGTGTLTVNVGSGTPLTINLTSSNNTLDGIAAAINGAANNPGVTAAVIHATGGDHLVVTSNATGAANTISMTAGSGVNAALNTANMTQVTAAQDAKFTVDGSAVTSPTNTVTNVLNGVTLTLSPAVPLNTPQTLTVASDTTAQTKAINSFVTAYNSYVTTASALSSFTTPSGATSPTAGPLLGDAMEMTITNGLASIISSGIAVGGKTLSLSSIGLNLQPDGTLQVDNNALQTALTTNSSAVSQLFNTTNGMGVALNSFVTTYVQTSGVIDTRTAAINADLSSLTDQQTTLTNYANTLTSQYNAQFTALNNLMAQMANNTQYLTQLFGGSSSAGALATNK